MARLTEMAGRQRRRQLMIKLGIRPRQWKSASPPLHSFTKCCATFQSPQVVRSQIWGLDLIQKAPLCPRTAHCDTGWLSVTQRRERSTGQQTRFYSDWKKIHLVWGWIENLNCCPQLVMSKQRKKVSDFDPFLGVGERLFPFCMCLHAWHMPPAICSKPPILTHCSIPIQCRDFQRLPRLTYSAWGRRLSINPLWVRECWAPTERGAAVGSK